MSLRQLAGAALSSKSHLHDLEHGHKTPRLDTLQRIDQALGAGGQLARSVVDGVFKLMSACFARPYVSDAMVGKMLGPFWLV